MWIFMQLSPAFTHMIFLIITEPVTLLRLFTCIISKFGTSVDV
jgi:hypothetical protein